MINYSETTAATIAAVLLIRHRVHYGRKNPSRIDAILLNAALHLEGRHAEATPRPEAGAQANPQPPAAPTFALQ